MLIWPIALPLHANSANAANSVNAANVANAANAANSANDKQSKPLTAQPAMSQELFRFDSPAAAAAWGATDDRVMGGVSQSRMRYDAAGHGVFEGVMSLDQNGGFASVRAALTSTTMAAATGYILNVRGDGKRYKLNLRTAGRFDAVSYQASFDTTANVWTTVRLPAVAFEPTFRGRRVNAPPLDPKLVREAGLMIADKQEGSFALHIRAIAAQGR